MKLSIFLDRLNLGEIKKIFINLSIFDFTNFILILSGKAEFYMASCLFYNRFVRNQAQISEKLSNFQASVEAGNFRKLSNGRMKPVKESQKDMMLSSQKDIPF